eukprot:scaffold86980_cov21-Prasinocladus_malaysianus.AAC.1
MAMGVTPTIASATEHPKMSEMHGTLPPGNRRDGKLGALIHEKTTMSYDLAVQARRGFIY